MKSDCQLSKYCAVCQNSLRRCQQTHISFDQYCISHKNYTIKPSHQAAAALGPEVRRECPMT